MRLDVTEASDEYDEQLKQLGVRGVPSVILFESGGAEAGRLDGVAAPDDVVGLVEALDLDFQGVRY